DTRREYSATVSAARCSEVFTVSPEGSQAAPCEVGEGFVPVGTVRMGFPPHSDSEGHGSEASTSVAGEGARARGWSNHRLRRSYGKPCLILRSVFAEHNHHARKRRTVLGVPDFQPATEKADFPRVRNHPSVEPRRVRPRGK